VPSSAVDAGPVVGETTVAFRFADSGEAIRAVRLAQDVRIPGDQLDFTRGNDAWELTIPRPDVWRMEYQLELTHADGGTEHVCDPANPFRAPSAFGEKSELRMPGYREPSWIFGEPSPGGFSEATIQARALGTELAVRIWSPPGSRDDERLPLLVAHDGPEYDELARLTTYLGVLVEGGRLPRLRAALLPPGPRDDWYSGDGAYTRALCLAIVPQLVRSVATSVVVGMGASLGAFAMLHAQRRHPTTFDALFLQSGSFFHPRLDAHERRFSHYDRIVRSVDGTLRAGGHRSPVPVVMTCGRIEENIANNRMMARALAAQGYDVALRELPDVHNYTAWRDAFDPYLTRLLRMVAA